VLQENPLKISIRLNPDDPDFNRISVLHGQTLQTIDLNERLGIDPNNPDNPFYGGLWLFPARYDENTRKYRMDIEFGNFAGFDSIEITDVWGKGLRITQN
jgi:hypothetical protein